MIYYIHTITKEKINAYVYQLLSSEEKLMYVKLTNE